MRFLQLFTLLVFFQGCGPSIVTFTNGQTAEAVIGQLDFTSVTSGTTATTLNEPYGVAASNGRLYLVDATNSRVLGFNSVPTSSGSDASFVVGQSDFLSGASGTTTSRLWGPAGVSVASGKMAIADSTNHRILIFNSVPRANGEAGDVVLGQVGSGCSSGALSNPEGVSVRAGKLLIADSNNNRVLIYNSIPSSGTATPDLVLGQTDFNTCTDGLTASTFDRPNGVWTDGRRVVVTDGLNNRILIWNTFPTASGQAADLVLGQEAFTTNLATPRSASSLSYPHAAFVKGDQLFVADCSNNRVLIWNSFPAVSGQAADVVLGQSDFSTATAGASQTGFEGCPSGVVLSGKRLIVTDADGNRALVFKGE